MDDEEKKEPMTPPQDRIQKPTNGEGEGDKDLTTVPAPLDSEGAVEEKKGGNPSSFPPPTSTSQDLSDSADPTATSMSEEELNRQLENELLTTCVTMVQCAWRQRAAQLKCCDMAVANIEKIWDPRCVQSFTALPLPRAHPPPDTPFLLPRPRTESFYYYNVRLDKSRWEPPVFFKFARKEITKVSPTYSGMQATKMIQTMLRCRLARKKVRSLLKDHVDKVRDEQTNSFYYYNRLLKTTIWDKPKIWGKEDLEDYNGERAKKKAMAARRSSVSGGAGRIGRRRTSVVRPDTGESIVPPSIADGGSRPETAESEWTEYDEDGNPISSRPTTRGTEFTETGEEDEDEEGGDGSGEEEEDSGVDVESGDDDSDDDSDSDKESEDETLSLLPRRYPRGAMQLLIDEAEDYVWRVNHPEEIPAEIGGEEGQEEGEREGEEGGEMTSNTGTPAPSKPGTPATSKPSTDAGGSRLGTSTGSKPSTAVGGSKATSETEKTATEDSEGGGEEEDGEANDTGADDKVEEEPKEPPNPHAFTLNLSNLKAPRLTSRIYDLGTNLTSLDLSHNRLTRISPDIGELTGLISLNISNNRIAKLPAELEDLVNLKKFDMSWNNLRKYPPMIYKLPLTHWNVSNNELIEIPVEVGNLQLLQETKEWEVGLGIMTTLVEYQAAGNRLEKWPAQIERCVNLEVLDLSNNLLKEIPLETKENALLRHVDIHKNRFKKLPGIINEWDKIEFFDVSQNKLDRFPKDLSGWSNKLAELNISSNQLEEVRGGEATAKSSHRLLT